MLPVVRDNNNPPTYTGGPLTISNTSGRQAAIFCPTARAPAQDSTFKAESYRERSLTYARGYKEKVNIQISDGIWKWRRIVFHMKGTPWGFVTNSSSLNEILTYYESPGSGMMRAIPLFGTQFSPDPVEQTLFDGAKGVDWVDVFSAKVDTSFVNVVSDRTINLNNSSGEGQALTKNCWYPLNKSLLYSDDEYGKGTTTQYFATQGKIGMGNLFVYDTWECVVGAGQLRFSPEGTYYWHER